MDTYWQSRVKALAGSLQGQLLLLIVLAGGLYFATTYIQHALAFLPFAFILLCPLMHLFMHHGHGGDNQHTGRHQGDASTYVVAAGDEGIN